MLTEKQLNNRASILPIEDIFTDADVNPSTDYDSRRGYKFEYPARWMNDPSEYKRIGIRELEVTPTSHTFSMGIRIYTELADVPSYTVDDLLDSGNWRAGEQRTIISTKNWHEVESYWNKYAIPQRTSGTIVITSPIEYPRDEISRTTYYDGYGQINMYLVENNFRPLVTTWMFEYTYDNRYEITEIVYETFELCSETYLETAPIDLSYTSENGTEEIMKHICNSFNGSIFKLKMYTDDSATAPANVGVYSLTYDYDYRTGHLSLKLHSRNERNERVYNTFSFYSGFTENDLNDITELFNQPKPTDGTPNKLLFIRDSKYAPITMELNNIWNRKLLFVHASFSESRRNIIGTSGDWYDSPSKFFHAPTNTSEFNIWFTTDGKNVILPLYCPFVIELCFLMNYKTAKFT